VSKFKDAGHIVRLAVASAVVFMIFLLLRMAATPKSFNEYGHYRGDALNELASQDLSYAGHKACEDCHGDVAELKTTGMHKGVNCEACHGPLAKHVEDPGSVVPQLPDTSMLCPRCHEANLAKPKTFPQVVSAEHSGGAVCKGCHQPHSPLLPPGGAKS